MSPASSKYVGPLLLVGLCLALLAGWWLWRRFLSPGLDPRGIRRAEWWLSIWVLSLVILPGIAGRLVDIYERKWTATTADWVWLVSFMVLGVSLLWRLPRLWRAARRERLAAVGRAAAVPTLRRQLTLILLPVLGLALVGLVSLVRDRAAVEAAARREAEEVAQELADKLSSAWPGRLSEVELAGNVWNGDGVVGPATVHWPGEISSSVDPDKVAERFLEQGRRNYLGRPEDALPVVVRFAADGTLIEPQPYPPVPRPAAWSRNLTGPAEEAWDNLMTAERAAGQPERLLAAVDRLKAATQDPGPVRQAEFFVLRHSAADEAEAVGKLLEFGRRAVVDRLETAGGLPLGVAALAEAARRAPQARLEREWFRLLGELTFTQPSSLTPWALALGDELAKRSGEPQPAALVGELRARWNSAERLRELGAQLAEATRPTPMRQHNLWFTNRGAGWLAVIQPGRSFTHTSMNGHSITLTNVESQARLFNADTLALTAFNGLQKATVVNGRERSFPPRLPAGLAVSLELEGRRLFLPAASWTIPQTAANNPVLAEARDEFRQEGQMLDTAGRFDAWPSRPRFTVRVRLADSAALFAAQRRQQWLFGGMILLTAGVAGLGAWQMNRAFRRQLALNEEKSNFVASVSHELRTPLASLRLLAEGFAAGRVQEEAKRREYAGFLVQESRRLGALVENVLDFARIEQGRKRYQFEPTDLVRLVSATVKLMEPLARERSVRVEFQRSAGMPDAGLEVQADGPALQQALVNLLDNALKHAPADSVVTVALEPMGVDRSAVRLSVADAGPGIPPEDHARIFERFYRRGSELRRETQGIGLGLAIVKHIVEGHGGRVWLESEPGKGARFVVELPCARAESVQ